MVRAGFVPADAIMESPELFILSLNLLVILLAYGVIYPRFAGSDLTRLIKLDAITSCVPLIIAGTLFWGSGQGFSAGPVEFNWFWFTLLTYLLMESPAMVWYLRRHQIKL